MGVRKLVTDPETSKRLSRIPQRDTGPEVVVRRLLHALGLRFRVRNRDLPGSPDIANRTRRWAVFVHGCFWHAHTGCPKATTPKRNREFWEAKLAANRARDQRAVAQLRDAGWRVETVWECELSSADRSGRVATRLARTIGRMR
ncbi:MAG: DNA mismatch endonuclease Vsr [Gemmatimonadetes bacterium]|jgi:DNA mismatch endonuclease (patch repair protein)|nr:DNA mismatch endonuclease Vsr [Gemmatimonadota bacterium]